MEVEQSVSKILVDNQSYKQENENLKNLAVSLLYPYQDNLFRSIEIKESTLELKSLIEQLLGLFVCLKDNQTPSLQLILAQHKERQLYTQENIETEKDDPWGTLQKMTKKDNTLKTSI